MTQARLKWIKVIPQAESPYACLMFDDGSLGVYPGRISSTVRDCLRKYGPPCAIVREKPPVVMQPWDMRGCH